MPSWVLYTGGNSLRHQTFWTMESNIKRPSCTSLRRYKSTGLSKLGNVSKTFKNNFQSQKCPEVDSFHHFKLTRIQWNPVALLVKKRKGLSHQHEKKEILVFFNGPTNHLFSSQRNELCFCSSILITLATTSMTQKPRLHINHLVTDSKNHVPAEPWLKWMKSSSWWFQPSWKNISQIGNPPQIGMNIKDISNHQPGNHRPRHFQEFCLSKRSGAVKSRSISSKFWVACHVSASPDGCFVYIWYLHVYGCLNEWWYPQIIHFNTVFHYKPSILGYPYFWKQPYTPVKTKMTMEKPRIRRCTS